MDLDKYFNDPKNGLVGIEKAYQKLKKEGFTRKQVEEAFKKNQLYQTHKQTKPTYQRILVKVPFQHYQIDLIDMSNWEKKNKGYSWILNMIDLFSKQAYSIPLKSKSDTDVLNGLSEIIDKNILHPLVIQSDFGNEFVNKKMGKYLSDNDIWHAISRPYNPQTNGGVERFNRTLKSMIYKLFVLRDSNVWYDTLEDLLENYNSSYHRTIKMEPNKVSMKNRKEVYENIKNSVFDKKITNQKKLNIGDYVRVKLPRAIFDKKAKQTYSDNIYQIKGVKPGQQGLTYDSYLLVDANDRKLKQTFLYSQLQKTDKQQPLSKTNLEEFSKVVEAARKNMVDLGTSKKVAIETVERVKKGEKPIVPVNLESKRPKREAHPTKKFLESVAQKKSKK